MCGYRSEVLSDENIIYLANKKLLSRGQTPITSVKRFRLNRSDWSDKVWGIRDGIDMCSLGEVVYIPGLGETFNMF